VCRTIPQLLSDAAARNPDGTWIRTDDTQLTFSAAAAAVGDRAAALRAHGVRHGDLIALTARTTPPYVLSWLAIMSLGAIAVPMNPASSLAEFAGLLAQTRPRVVITDDAFAVVPRVDDLGARRR
jgi:acyl-CoA synthetase (AMP-forming)/AMP-acid ligase II